MDLILLVLLAATPVAPMSTEGCRLEEQPPLTEWPLDPDTGQRTLRRRADLDGNGFDDLLELTGGGGSGSSYRAVRVVLDSGEVLEADATFPFDAMTTRIPVPASLATASAGVREAMEEALFGRVCAAPEASLARLLGEPAGVQWAQGPPALPENYAVLDRGGAAAEWISYLGWVHRMERKGRPMLRSEGQVGDLEVLSTAHGVLLWDAAGQRHAWIYVYPGAPGHKLRWQSVQQVELLEHVVVVKVGQMVGEMETVRLDLDLLGAFGEPSPPAE